MNTNDKIVSADKGKHDSEENTTCLANVYCNRENVKITLQCLRMKRNGWNIQMQKNKSVSQIKKVKLDFAYCGVW